MISYAPVGWRALTHGKMPPIRHKNVENVENVRRLFRKLEPELAGRKLAKTLPLAKQGRRPAAEGGHCPWFEGRTYRRN